MIIIKINIMKTNILNRRSDFQTEPIYNIDKNRKEEIKKIVDEILHKNNLTQPGFDLIKFLSAPSSFDDNNPFQISMQTMDIDITGLLLVDDNDVIPGTNVHKLIVINDLLQNEPDYRKRRRFIIAHEYGHYILHKKDAVQYARRETTNKSNIEEQEAEYFARCLLMPERIIRQIVSLDFVSNLSDKGKVVLISRSFRVTEKKATQRLKEDLHII